jgi:ribulose-phosphate 3-epimerase
MKKPIDILPAIMPKDASELQSLAEMIATFSPSAHLDVMDGVFVRGVSWPFTVDNSFLMDIVLPKNIAEWGVHLMTAEVQDLGLHFIRAGAHRVTGHFEAVTGVPQARTMMKMWKDAGAETGLGVLMQTPLEEIDKVLEGGNVDVVQLMTIAEIGVQGNPFDQQAIARIETLHSWYPDLTIAVDGGVTNENIDTLIRSGASRCVVGSFIMNAENPASTYQSLKEITKPTV